MKKTLLSFAALAAVISAGAQTTYNYFDPADCDANGWLWLDTQEKLDKYCGYTSEYKILLSGATYEDPEGQYAECVLDGEIQGYNADGEQGGAGSWVGAIIAPQAKTYGTQNGGGIILSLPDLAEFSVAMSCESRLRSMILMGGKGANVERIDMGIVTGFLVPFTALSDKCQYSWNNLQNFTHATTGLTLHSPAGQPVTAGLFTDQPTDVLIQGLRVFTYTDNGYGAVDGIEADNDAPVSFYNLQGVKVSGDQPGVYVRRQGSKASKVIVK